MEAALAAALAAVRHGVRILPADADGQIGALDELERFERLRRFRLENFVTSSKDLRWCPGAGCDKIVRSGAACTSVKCTVANGGCGAAFCVRCGEEAHQPAGCPALAEWAEKCQNESETANWILANTKRCPKCQTRIEKNQGCNHMSCSQCKYEFCWMCMVAPRRLSSLRFESCVASMA